MKQGITFVLLLLFLAETATSAKIEHVVSLMLENRAFDHMLGYLHKVRPEVNGLNGDEFNFVDPSNPTKSKKIFVSDTAEYRIHSPDHSVRGTFLQAFGEEPSGNYSGLVPPMTGFISSFIKKSDGDVSTGVKIMESFKLEKIPVLTTLANEFALFDAWHASVPGPTVVNRQFFHAALGSVWGDGLDTGVTGKTIYDSLHENNLSWTCYYPEWSSLPWFKTMRKPENIVNLKMYSQFEADAKAGRLPNYTFIEPRYFTLSSDVQAQDQHPANSVYQGELLIKEVYEILRASPLWEKTALLVTYDEHGGFYDHVPLPGDGVPNPAPDVRTYFSSSTYFNFDRLGVRVPAIVISPWVKKGRLVHDPPHGPYPTSKFDHTSLAATLKRMWGMKDYLTKRDAWAGSFEFLFDELDSPRTDCPETLPNPPCEPFNHLTGLEASLSDLHFEWMDLIHEIHPSPHHPHKDDVSNQLHGAEFVSLKMMEFKADALSDVECQNSLQAYQDCSKQHSDPKKGLDAHWKFCKDIYHNYSICYCDQFIDNQGCQSQCVTYRDCIGHQASKIKEWCIPDFNDYKSCLLGGVDVYTKPHYRTDPCATTYLLTQAVFWSVAGCIILGVALGITCLVKRRKDAQKSDHILLDTFNNDQDPEESALQSGTVPLEEED